VILPADGKKKKTFETSMDFTGMHAGSKLPPQKILPDHNQIRGI